MNQSLERRTLINNNNNDHTIKKFIYILHKKINFNILLKRKIYIIIMSDEKNNLLIIKLI